MTLTKVIVLVPRQQKIRKFLISKQAALHCRFPRSQIEIGWRIADVLFVKRCVGETI